MPRTITHLILIFIVLLICGLSMYPPSEKLRRGRDLAGGVTLVYSVDLEGVDNPGETIDAMIEVLKKRVDPQGLYEIAFVRSGRDRIEVSMPLPTEEVKELRRRYQEMLEQLEADAIDEAQIDRLVRLSRVEREEAIARLSGGSELMESTLREVVETFQASRDARDAYDAAVEEDAPDAVIDDLLERAADARVAYETAREAAERMAISADELEFILSLPTERERLRDNQTGEVVELPSPREKALERLRADHPQSVDEIDSIVATYDEYAANRAGFDDPQDLKRLLRGSGVLSFRIAYTADAPPANEADLRRELAEKGPRLARSDVAGWYQIQDPSTWYTSTQQLRQLEENPAAFFRGRGLLAAERDGLYYMLLHEEDELSLTPADGDWAVSRAFPTVDQMGRPAIGFEMNARGANFLADLTGDNIGLPMAVLLDDQVYTAPTLQGRISTNGQITGQFSQRELQYIIRTLGAGSLQAKLAPEPISEEVIGPELGADNLRQGFEAARWALIAVAIFMVFYYFSSGFVAFICLLCNAIIILGVMSLQRAAFTLPGIAGIVLTFGMAVDANVLIYERIREELLAGADLKAAVRLGYQKVLSTIIDANVTNLIVCFVLYYFATPEIRGFAITLGVGIVATLFSALFVSRVIFTIFVDHIQLNAVRAQLPMVIPALQRALSPAVNWLRMRTIFIPVSLILLGIGISMAFIQGAEMFGHQFRGGVSVAVQLKPDVTLARPEVEERISDIAEGVEAESPLASLRDAEVLAVSPEADGVTSNEFKIKTVSQSDDARDAIRDAIVQALSDVMEASPPLQFEGASYEDMSQAPVFRVVDSQLGESIGQPQYAIDVSDYLGGVAIVIEDISPPPTKRSLETRLTQMRQQADFSDLGLHRSELIVLDGTEDEVEAAAIVAVDDVITFFDDDERWRAEVAQREWELARAALTTSTTLAGVQSFSPQIASTFQAQAITAIILSFLGIMMYVWVRFGSLRYSLAALVALLHDVIAVVGLIALAEIVYEAAPAFASNLLLEPFKIDLALIAALLTIIGYSLNDTIVILDRIRENRGKLAYASADVVNTSINQTFSRTIITSGTTMVAVFLMYVMGGEGLRGFTYALLCGVLIGTYSSVAVAAPLVYSSRSQPPASRRELREQALRADDRALATA